MMSFAYFDTSALVKYYITETGSHWVQSLLHDRETVVFTSALTGIEGVCTFARRHREGMLSAGDLADISAVLQYDLAHRYETTVVDTVLLQRAQQLALRQPLRAYDAVQLATAVLVNEQLTQAKESSLTFICADERLLAIAQQESLLTDNPNRHP